MSEIDFRRAWQSQSATLPSLSPGDLRDQAVALQRRIARRNLREYLGGAVVVPAFSIYAWYFQDWAIRLGALLVILGTLLVMWQIHVRAAARALPGDFGCTGLRFQRGELCRQRDALRGVWRWYLGPLVPGLVVFMWGVQGGLAGPVVLPADLMMVTASSLIIWLNRRAAASLQRRIDALDALAAPTEDR